MINAAMKNTAKALLVSSTLAVTTMASAALPSQWQLDDSHTRVGFSVEHMGFSTVMGHFSDVEGTVQFDLKNPNQAQLNFVIDTDSIDTAWKARDEHLGDGGAHLGADVGVKYGHQNRVLHHQRMGV